MIDFHSHILPKLDDGSASLEMSIAMLRMEAEQGITHVVATPHFYANYDKPQEFLARRDRAEEALRREIEKHGDLPQLTVGAEVRFFRGISDSELIPRLTIGGKSYIMIEMPAPPWTPSMYEELRQIYKEWNIVPIIAHVDRYIAPLRTFSIPERLADCPVLVQANADFFVKRPSAAIRMLRKEQIHLLGSDCHNLTSRKPNLRPALDSIEKRLGKEMVDRICRQGLQILD